MRHSKDLFKAFSVKEKAPATHRGFSFITSILTDGAKLLRHVLVS
jgi:hypothetical protein